MSTPLRDLEIKPFYASKALVGILLATIAAISPLAINAAEKGKLTVSDAIAILSAASLAGLGAYSRILPGNITTPDGSYGPNFGDEGKTLVRTVKAKRAKRKSKVDTSNTVELPVEEPRLPPDNPDKV